MKNFHLVFCVEKSMDNSLLEVKCTSQSKYGFIIVFEQLLGAQIF